MGCCWGKDSSDSSPQPGDVDRVRGRVRNQRPVPVTRPPTRDNNYLGNANAAVPTHPVARLPPRRLPEPRERQRVPGVVLPDISNQLPVFRKPIAQSVTPAAPVFVNVWRYQDQIGIEDEDEDDEEEEEKREKEKDDERPFFQTFFAAVNRSQGYPGILARWQVEDREASSNRTGRVDWYNVWLETDVGYIKTLERVQQRVKRRGFTQAERHKMLDRAKKVVNRRAGAYEAAKLRGSADSGHLTALNSWRDVQKTLQSLLGNNAGKGRRSKNRRRKRVR
ncbi:uncharacterized protein [Heptranchias perlo]|uniref:uncharacterized protein n=1 Tax=Heptranchias perlo TaxID=212740 RepID=UPI003559416C